MQLDAAIIGTVITVFFALLGLAYGYGSLNTRTKANGDNISTLFDKFSEYQKENKIDHERIISKIDAIKNGNKSS